MQSPKLMGDITGARVQTLTVYIVMCELSFKCRFLSPTQP